MRRFNIVVVAMGLALVANSFGSLALAQAEGKYAAQVKEAMKAMIAEATKMGAPKLEGPLLMFGGSRMNGNYALVDSLKEKYKCTATLFAKKGEGFVRIATNVIKEDGTRAVGTVLDPKGPAIAAINKGEAFYGVADILGKKYETGYEPIRNAAGETVGIYYIGYLIE